jgi:glucoamylase
MIEIFTITKKQISKIRFLSVFICVHLWIISSVFAQEKGKDAEWESAGKQGIGTALSEKSKVWFTLEGGSLTEVFYPTADKANVQWLQFVVVNPKTKKVVLLRDFTKTNWIFPKFGELKIYNREDRANNCLCPSSMTFGEKELGEKKKWTLSYQIISDPDSNTVQISVGFGKADSNLNLYVYYNPSLNNSGMGDTAWNEGEALFSQDGDISSVLVADKPLTEISSGFYGVNDGFEQLQKDSKITTPNPKAENGNVAQLAKVNLVKNNIVTFALSFGKTPKEALETAQTSLKKGFYKTSLEYQKGWGDFVKTLPLVDKEFQAQFDMSAMTLRALEDKTYRGGNVASLSKPWIPKGDANGEYVSGYHLVWSRDLYQVASAFIAMGDKDSANRALNYLFKYQQQKDGSYPQMTWIDGRIVGDSLQMDEVAYPLILAYQLGRNDRQTYEKHIKPTADFIVKTGPTTKQERWEEKGGYSPATIAAEIAGLVCAADIASKNGDENSAKIWLEKADDWAKNVEKWTATTKGKYGDGNYYLRLTKKGTPDAGEKIELNNGAGTWLESEIVDAGFLELVRFGIKSPNDPLIVKSLKVVDEVLRVKTPNGDGFYRYTHDGYGEYHDGRNWNYDRTWTGKGHLWALLSGERGQFEIAECGMRNADFKDQRPKTKDQCLSNTKRRLDAMQKFANDGMMIPEQVWSQNNGVFPFGEGARSATPLAWSMAQFIRLAMNLKAGKNLDTPEVVAKRFGNLK